jgi:hypothetical protein
VPHPQNADAVAKPAKNNQVKVDVRQVPLSHTTPKVILHAPQQLRMAAMEPCLHRRWLLLLSTHQMQEKTRFLKFAGALSYWDSDHSVVRQMHTMQTQSRHRYHITYTHEQITLAEQYASMRWHAARRLGSSETRRRIVSLGGWRSSQALVGRRHVTGGTTCMTAQRIKTTITF